MPPTQKLQLLDTKLNIKIFGIALIVLYLILAGCTSDQIPNILTESETPEITASPIVIEDTPPSTTLPEQPTQVALTASPTIEIDRDFSEIEETIIYFVTPSGYHSLKLPCWDEEETCEEKSQTETLDGQLGDCLRFSPDGSMAVFCKGRTEEKWHDFYRINFSDGEITKLTNDPDHYKRYPAWSPMGDMIAYWALSLETEESQIFLVNVKNGYKQRLFSSYAIKGSPTWSPDGNAIAILGKIEFESNNLVIIFDINTEEIIELEVSLDTQISSPAWSPDGTRIAFWAGDEFGNSNLCIIEIYTSEMVCPNTPRYNIQSFSWFPDGSKLIYEAFDKEATPLGVVEIFSTNLDATEITHIIHSGQCRDPIVIGQGGFFICEMYVMTAESDTPIFLYSIDGKWEKQLIPYGRMLHITDVLGPYISVIPGYYP